MGTGGTAIVLGGGGVLGAVQVGLATVGDHVEVHVLPAGEGGAPRWDSRAALRYP